MPNTNRFQPIWLGMFNNPDQTLITSTDMYSQGGQPGSIGMTHDWETKTYQRVRLDSGSTSATPNGLPAANDLLYWKDRTTYTVTADRRATDASLTNDAYRNCVAGVLRVSPTDAQIAAGLFIDVLQRGPSINVASASGGADGDQAVAEAGANNRVVAVTAGTAVTVASLGTLQGASAANVVVMNVDIPNIP